MGWGHENRLLQEMQDVYLIFANLLLINRPWTESFQTRLFNQHAETQRHKRLMNMPLDSGQKKLDLSSAWKHMDDDIVWIRIVAAFWLAKRDMAIHNFSGLVESYYFVKGMPPPKGYIDDHAAWEMVEVLARYFRRLLKRRIQRSPYYGIMTDEATDLTADQKLIIYIKYLDKNENGDWAVVIEYLDLVSPPGQEAADIKVCNLEPSRVFLRVEHHRKMFRIFWIEFATPCWVWSRWLLNYDGTKVWGRSEIEGTLSLPCRFSLSCASAATRLVRHRRNGKIKATK